MDLDTVRRRGLSDRMLALTQLYAGWGSAYAAYEARVWASARRVLA